VQEQREQQGSLAPAAECQLPLPVEQHERT
jgi:hypothetical protein